MCQSITYLTTVYYNTKYAPMQYFLIKKFNFFEKKRLRLTQPLFVYSFLLLVRLYWESCWRSSVLSFSLIAIFSIISLTMRSMVEFSE